MTFIYSRSGNGEIHSVRGKAIYMAGKTAPKADMNNIVKVHYNWIEEEAVDLNGGAFVVFLAVFVVSVFFLFDLCGLCDNGTDDDPSDRYSGVRTTSTSSGSNSNYHGSHHAPPIDAMAVMGGSRIPKYE